MKDMTIKRSAFCALALLCTLSWTVQTYPIFSLITSLRDAFASRVTSDVSEEEIVFLEQQEGNPQAQFQASMLRTTWSDFGHPFAAQCASEYIGSKTETPVNSIGANTSFNVLYKWFAKKITFKEIVPALFKGVLASSVVFSVNQMAGTMHPDWVKKRWWTRMFAGKLCGRIAIAVGIALLGTCIQDNTGVSG